MPARHHASPVGQRAFATVTAALAASLVAAGSQSALVDPLRALQSADPRTVTTTPVRQR
jgi:hypothetical protein